MANTPFEKLSSEEILSAHINGLTKSINNIEDILNMKTKAIEIQLKPIIDQDDASLRYRIYESPSFRNWTNATVKRNGTAVNSNEYISYKSFGAIVFLISQQSTDIITADINYICNESTKIEQISSDIEILKKVEQYDDTEIKNSIGILNNLTTIAKDSLVNSINEIKSSIGSGGESNIDITKLAIQQFPLPTNNKIYTNLLPGLDISTAVISDSISMGANTLDAIPVYINSRITVSQIRIDIASNSTLGTMILGIYKNSNAQPNELIEQTNSFTTSIGQLIKNLKTNVILEPGLYWIARYQGYAVKLKGFTWDDTKFISLQDPLSSSLINSNPTGTTLCGVRSQPQGTLTSLPSIFPVISNEVSGSRYLGREFFGAMYLYS